MRYALICALTIRLTAAAERDPGEVMARVIWKVVAAARHIPNYTCVETVSRQFFRPAANNLPRACESLLEARRHPTPDMVLHWFATDRLRLDVAMTEQGEIFSWVGASKFDEEFIDHLIRTGPMGTGAFGSMLFVTFESDVKKFKFVGNPVVEGRSLFEYSFQVSKPESHYKVRVGDSWVFTGYSGTLQVDPETDDLVGISVETAELPRASGECFSLTRLEFGIVRIGDAPFLLPKLAHQRFVSPTGGEVENTTEFSNCREYRGESTVTFEEAPPVGGSDTRNAPAKNLSVPARSRFTLELTLPISGDRAAAGDPFTGRLIDALRDPQKKVLAPRGTVVKGHLLRVASYRMPPQVVVVLRPEALEIKGVRMPLTAVPDWTHGMNDIRIQDRKRIVFVLPEPGEEYSVALRFPGEHAVIPKGFQSDWQTVAVR